MNQQDVINLLQNAKLFINFSQDDLVELAKKTTHKLFKINEYLLQVNESSSEIYIIKKGKVQVSHPSKSGEYIITTLESGASIGELSILYNQKNTVNITALEPTEVLMINKNDIHLLLQDNSRNKLAENINNIMLTNNKSMTALLSHELDQKRQYFSMGEFIINTLLLFSFYNLTLALSQHLISNPYTSLFASTSLIIVFTAVFVVMAVKLRQPFSYYGVTLTNWKTVIPGSLYYTFIFILVLTIAKFILMHTTTLFPNRPLFDFTAAIAVAKPGTLTYWMWLAIGMFIYGFFVPLQEFISRGILQSSLQSFLQGRDHKIKANIVASSIFAAGHIHISPVFALISIVPSLFWGWLYIKHKTLLSPTISHLLIGWWAIFVLGLEKI